MHHYQICTGQKVRSQAIGLRCSAARPSRSGIRNVSFLGLRGRERQKENAFDPPEGQKVHPQQGFLRPQRTETYNPCTLGSYCGVPHCISFFGGHDVVVVPQRD
jgi:hypothetical protein